MKPPKKNPADESAQRLGIYGKVISEMLDDPNFTIPFVVDLSDALARPAEKRALAKRPSRSQLSALVADAQRVITFNGGTATRIPPKRQHIDLLSYAYGVLWGIATALDSPLAEVVERFGQTRGRRKRSSARSTPL